MKYLAVSLEEGGEWDATVQADVGCDSLPDEEEPEEEPKESK